MWKHTFTAVALVLIPAYAFAAGQASPEDLPACTIPVSRDALALLFAKNEARMIRTGTVLEVKIERLEGMLRTLIEARERAAILKRARQ